MLEDDLKTLNELTLINEEFYAAQVSETQLDELLAEGWRHFGIHFFRYSFGFYQNDIRRVIPLRIRLSEFLHSKSQRRILRKNDDLDVKIRPTVIDGEKERLFELHRTRFRRGRPYSIFDFLSGDAATIPCPGFEVSLFLDGEMVACSFFDVGRNSISSIYAMFDPDHGKRSLGIMTMLIEIEYAIETGKRFYYQGYSYEGRSFYDYKKRFTALECYDWKGSWNNFRRTGAGN